ncbi:hypothetical protein [Noviherbaspirillum sp. ST9]|uniref:hypothetical protein n=1 Tax=Noviherbaspirillum sp. ST9 TaxID=3401606 RepID=UPI003B587F1D
MRNPKNNGIDNRRRQLLLGGLALSATGLLQACGGGGGGEELEGSASTAAGNAVPTSAQGSLLAETTVGTVTTPAPIPANIVNLADYGGVPGASASSIISAFNQAFTRLKNIGGGTLKINAGVYNLGTHSNVSVISVDSLQNVLISAYGAQLTMTTGTSSTSTTNNTPVFLNFNNPKNVTVAGLAFKDFGSDILFRSSGGRWGAICLNTFANTPCAGFKTVDCVADDVVTFVRSDNRSNPYQITGFDIHGTVRNSYYGVQMLRNGRYSKCTLTALNVRRAFLSQSARDWTVNVTTNRTAGIGSNAHVVLDAFPSWPVQDCNITIKASGDLDGYVSLGSICHQGADGTYSVAKNVKFNILIENATSAATTGFVSFTAEPEAGGGIRSTTVSAYENIQVSGQVVGTYSGRIVANPSVSSASTNSIYVGSKLAALQNMSALPSYFRVITQCTA